MYRAAVPIALDHLLAVVLAVLFPLRSAWFGYRRLVEGRARRRATRALWLYRQGIAISGP